MLSNKKTPMSYRRLKPVPLRDVYIQDGFWERRIRINRQVTLPLQYKLLEESGRINNFRRVSGKKPIDSEEIYCNSLACDSDVYKWLEAACYSLETHPDKRLQSKVESVVKEITDASDKNGYINTYFTFDRKKERWSNLKDMHELYCAGHLFEAAVAHHHVTGQKSLLRVAARFADHIWRTFGPDKRPGTCGHPEIELALVKLYRDTDDSRYLNLAQFFIDQRGQGLAGRGEYHQDHLPFREQRKIVGHAVRAVYLLCGAADVYSETGEQSLFDALDNLWHNMVERRIYITGGIGARYDEAFGKDYELPNDGAFTETCAAIGSIFWNFRMLQLTGKACYADIMETTLYNSFLSGVSLYGKRYFYQNPLADDGTHRRQEWFTCACCPPNLARLLASLAGYFYSVSDEGIWIHLYGTSTATVSFGGNKITLNQQNSYPWDGDIKIKVFTDRQTKFILFLRVPQWCHGATATINQDLVEVNEKGGFYLSIDRHWKNGDTINLNLPIPVRLMECHPHASNNGRLAICRGPLVYCVEAADHHGIDIFNINLSLDIELTPSFESTLLGGITVLCGKALVIDSSHWQGQLYKIHRRDGGTKSRQIKITAIPYYAWANREHGKMQVWIPYRQRL